MTLTNIPHVESTAFKQYLSQVGSLFDAFQRAKTETEGGASQLFRRNKEADKDERFVEILERGLRREQQQPVTSPRDGSVSAPSPLESPQLRRRSSGGTGKRNSQAVTPLSTIPSVYFEENFHLENPRTFDIVSERSEVVRQPDSKAANGSANGAPPSGRKALATNAILQEKLSWYMDTVEIHLISSIASASSSFFAALGSLKDLQSEAADSVAKIKKLREDLADLDQKMAMGGLEVVGMKRRRENLRKLGEATEQLSCVVNGVTHCEELVDSGELEVALDRIGTVERLVTGKLDPASSTDIDWLSTGGLSAIIDLRRLKALDGVSEGMEQLRRRIGKGYEARFLEALLADLRQHVSAVPSRDTLQRWASASQRSRGDHARVRSTPPAYLSTNSKLRSDLFSILHGLGKSGQTAPATAAFSEAVMREIKSLIRQHLPSSTDDDAVSAASNSTRNSRVLSQQDKSAILARNLRALDPEAAEELLVRVYCGVGEALRRLSVQVKVLLDVTSSLGSPPTASGLKSPLRSPNVNSIDEYLSKPTTVEPSTGNLQEELAQALDMSSLLGQAVDVAQTQVTKILKVRAEQTARLPLQQFLRYFTLNRLFADECEAVSGRSGAALKGVINSQIHDFLPLMADVEKQQLAQIMDADKWEARDFGEAETMVLSRVLQGMTSDPAEWTKSTMIWEDNTTNGVDHMTASQSNGTGKEKTRSAIVDEENYILVESATAVLRGIDKFENLVAVIPSISPEVSAALLDYLKLFNSRSYQLILGAGATRSAGLKNINTKHLALASQALGFVIALIPYIREFIRRRPSSSSASLSEFDKVKRLYQDHQVSIHDKLIDIMSGRATAHVSAMRKIDFDKAADQQVSPHMETLTKETSTLHRVLSKHLPDVSVRMIMGPVFASYREQWGKAFSEASPKTGAGKARYVADSPSGYQLLTMVFVRLLRDAELFDAKLSKIDGAGDIGSYVANIAKNKKVDDTAPASASTANDRASSEDHIPTAEDGAEKT